MYLADRWVYPKLRYDLSVCAIFRDEAPYLHEWLTFHHAVGVDHFYLYNHLSEDGYPAVLEEWVRGGIVTLVEWRRPAPAQKSAYRDCLARAKWQTRWLAFLDLDEFLFSPESLDIRPILERFRDWPGIEVWEVKFGSSGHIRRPDGPVTEAYTMSGPVNEGVVKSITNPRMVYRPGVHQSKYWWGRGIDTSGQPVSKNRERIVDLLRINHYWSRSLEDLEAKVRKGRVYDGRPINRDHVFEFERTMTVPDTTILATARAIRAGAGRTAPLADRT